MFRFKQFAVAQDRTAMKVGTDGVLLGAWVALRGDERRLLDIGSGTGVIALMMAQRCDAAHVDGVEIDEASYGQACENVEVSPWSDRVVIHHSDIQGFMADKYDLIVTNPPYFVDSLLSPNESRSNARHTTTLSFADLVSAAVRLLANDGRFALILPTTEWQRFDAEARGELQLVRRCDLYSREGAPVKRILAEYKLSGSGVAELAVESLVIEAGKPPQFTEEYREVTRDFYLKF